MTGAKSLSTSTKNSIIAAILKGASYKSTASRFDVAKSTVAYLVKQFRETGDIKQRKIPGRPKCRRIEKIRQLFGCVKKIRSKVLHG